MSIASKRLETTVEVYVFRDTIEKSYIGEESLAKLSIKREWLEEYITKHKKQRSLQGWLDFYTANETKSLYEDASKAGAIVKMEFIKPVVIEDSTERKPFDLIYKAMRMLEIAGKTEEADRLFSEGTNNRKARSYTEAKELIRKYIDIEKEVEKPMIKVGTSLNVYSELNNQIDFIVNIGAYGEVEKAQEVIEKAYSEWFEEHERVGDSSIIEYISEKLKAVDIDFEIYVKLEEESE